MLTKTQKERIAIVALQKFQRWEKTEDRLAMLRKTATPDTIDKIERYRKRADNLRAFIDGMDETLRLLGLTRNYHCEGSEEDGTFREWFTIEDI